MRWICAIAVLGLCVICARADLIPVTISADDSALLSSLSGGSDPEWTTASNIALTGSLFELVMSLGGNEADIAALFQPGGALAGYSGGTVLVSDAGSNVVSGAVSNVVTSYPASSTPEPATMGLLFGALLLLFWYAMRRVRKIHHGPLQRSD
jgi:hypothetical protein